MLQPVAQERCFLMLQSSIKKSNHLKGTKIAQIRQIAKQLEIPRGFQICVFSLPIRIPKRYQKQPSNLPFPNFSMDPTHVANDPRHHKSIQRVQIFSRITFVSLPTLAGSEVDPRVLRGVPSSKILLMLFRKSGEKSTWDVQKNPGK